MKLSTPSLRGLVFLWYIAGFAWTPVLSQTPQTIRAGCAANSQSELCSMVEAGRLDSLRWPDFSDFRVEVRDFYLPSNYARAWTTENRLTSQAQAIIRALQGVEAKGLQAEDYDGLLWNDRVAHIASSGSKPSPAELDRFDLALTVSVLRYVSALHRGRVDPRRLRVDLNIDHNRYKLGEFVRSNLVKA
ncbi:MAG: hypothetical protein ACRD72_01865, partial [Candidatus Angelobacter sp.]